MVDIHAHILPGLDDGPQTMQESVEMAKIAALSDIHHIVATSHGNCFPYTLEEYREALDALRLELEHRRISVKLYSGMELFADENLLTRLKKEELLPLWDTSYLLIEFAFEENPSVVCQRVKELRQAGYRIVLAHPERYLFIQKDNELAWYLVELGCVLQINQGSLVGDFGPECQRLAVLMLQEGIVGVIATDAHDALYRSHDLQRTLRWLHAWYPEKAIHLWLSENPSRILKGMEILLEGSK